MSSDIAFFSVNLGVNLNKILKMSFVRYMRELCKRIDGNKVVFFLKTVLNIFVCCLL